MLRSWGWLPIVLLAGCFAPQEVPSSSPSKSLGPEEGNATWSARAELPVPRTEVACAALEGKIYLVGGFNASSVPVSQLDVYDVATDTWSRGADAPIPIHHTGMVAYKGMIYSFGGYTGLFPFVGVAQSFRYDPAQNAWTVETTLPVARGAHATMLHGDEVYLAGGAPQQPGSEIYRSVDVYNLTSRQWRTAPALAEGKEHLAGAVANGTLVVAGGRRMTLNNFDSTETFRPGDTSWKVEEPMPTARGGIAASAVGPFTIFFGGEQQGGTFAEAEGFDVHNRTWVSFPPMPTARHGLCSVVVDDSIHVIAGGPEPGFTVSGAHEVLRFEP